MTQADQIHTNEMTWGDLVMVNANAHIQYNPNSIGSLCGQRIILEEQNSFNVSVGEIVWLVEDSSGKAIEIPQKFLIKIETEE